jgi:hypothetical protein
LKTQILTLIPEKYSRNSIIEIFEISLYQYNLAMKQKQLKGVGQLEEKKTINRDKLNHNSVEIFLNFIMGDGYMQDVASGDTLMKFANVETYCIPLTIRLACHSKIINDYRLMCQQENLKPMSDSTCYKILKSCPASFRKSMQGLDNIICDGLNSFDAMEKIILYLKENGLEDDKSKTLNIVLNDSKNYLKFKYKRNLKFSSECSDHCAKFALSEKNLCSHTHFRNCVECNSFDLIFSDILASIKKTLVNEVKNEYIYKFNLHKKNILEMKHHLIRNWIQDQIKYKILNNLTKDEIYIHMDWAMKFMPQKYREKQEEFFCKRGINWHLSCVVFKNDSLSDSLSCLAFVHVFDSTAQDVDAVIGITDSVFKQIRDILGAKGIYFRTDNAGCYHNQVLIGIINLIAKKHGHNLLRYDFCEPQTGKDICDRKNITKFHSFEYSAEKLKSFNYYDIGSGVETEIENLVVNQLELIKKKVNEAKLTIVDMTGLPSESLITHKNKPTVLKCTIESCPYVCFYETKLEKHVNDHDMIKKMPQINKIMIKYAESLIETRTYNSSESKSFQEENIALLENVYNFQENGYAIKHRKNVRFSEKQRNFLLDKFNIGVQTNRKVTPEAVEAEMIALNDKFTFEERLSSKQIKSYFSTLAAKQRKDQNNNTKIKKSNKKQPKNDSSDSNEEDNNENDEENDNIINDIINQINNGQD